MSSGGKGCNNMPPSWKCTNGVKRRRLSTSFTSSTRTELLNVVVGSNLGQSWTNSEEGFGHFASRVLPKPTWRYLWTRSSVTADGRTHLSLVRRSKEDKASEDLRLERARRWFVSCAFYKALVTSARSHSTLGHGPETRLSRNSGFRLRERSSVARDDYKLIFSRSLLALQRDKLVFSSCLTI